MSKYSENMPPDIAGAIGWLLDYIKPGADFLDFGCSTGYFGAYIKQAKECHVYGVEISEDRKEAKKVLDGVYTFDLDGEWPKEIYERKYDNLFFGDVLEHLKSPTEALRKCTKLLKPGGKILVSVPNIAHMSIRFELLQGSFKYEPMGILDTTHLQYFTLSSFKTASIAAGFEAKLVDFTPNDIPAEVAEKQLDKLGLKASDTFWQKLKTTEARAYQYKFVLTPAGTTTATELPLQKPLQFRDDIISDYRFQLENLDAHSREQAKIISHFKNLSEQLEHENARLNKALEHLKKPLTYRVHHGVREVARKAKHSVRRGAK